MYPIMEGDYLSRISVFELHRGYAIFRIELHNFLAGPAAGTCELRVFSEENPVGKNKYWSSGVNEKALLHEFLSKIQHVMPSQLLDDQA